MNFSLQKDEYYERANADVFVIAAIETREGVENIGEIVSVEGLDGIFIGPADLSTSMGYMANPNVEEVREAIEKIERAVLKSEKFLGTVAPDIESAKKLYDRGYSLIYSMSDVTVLAKAASAAVKEFKKTYRK